MKKNIIILTLCIMLGVSLLTPVTAGYYEIGVPAISEPIQIYVKGSDGNLWEPGDPINDLWVTVEPQGASVTELFYNESDCVFVVWINSDQVYFEPTGAYVNGIKANLWQIDQDYYEVRVNSNEETSQSQEEPLLIIKAILTFWKFLKNFFSFFS